MKNSFLFFVAFFLYISNVFAQNVDNNAQKQTHTKVTILSESNICNTPGLNAERGFCVLIEKDGKQYLYDTGREGVCIENAKVLGKDLTKIEKIFLSHGHIDHTGGLEKVLKAIGHPVEVVAHPEVFGKKYAVWSTGAKTYIGIPFKKEHFENMHKATFDFHKELYEVAKGIWLTGEVPLDADAWNDIPKESRLEVNGKLEVDILPDDDTLVIDTDKGLVVITACGHHCIVNILEYIKNNINKEIYAVIGGMHLEGVERRHFQFVEKELMRIFKENNTQLFAPNHCTGKRAISEFRADFKGILRDASCGASFEF
jgi:7,8-dihydropterin-6-yl-methyl-4-(beta-D-ribofuranosyl)aminobenzene 5'-phosphate synthase